MPDTITGPRLKQMCDFFLILPIPLFAFGSNGSNSFFRSVLKTKLYFISGLLGLFGHWRVGLGDFLKNSG